MHTHTLHAHTHAAFLESQRHDPITGDAFKAGDEVVFCASCRSAFLRESWEYMGQTHCGQSETLVDFPETSPINLNDRPERDDKILLSSLKIEGKYILAHEKMGKQRFLRQKVLEGKEVILSVGFLLIGVLAGCFVWSVSVGALLLFLITLAIGVSAFFLNDFYKEEQVNFLALGKSYVHFFKRKIHYSRIKSLHIRLLDGKRTSSLSSPFSTLNVRVIVQEEEGGKEVLFRRTLRPHERETLFSALRDIAQTTAVYVSSVMPTDRELIKRISQESKVNFFLWEDSTFEEVESALEEVENEPEEPRRRRQRHQMEEPPSTYQRQRGQPGPGQYSENDE